MRSIFAERRFPDQSCKNNLNVLYFLWVEGWNGDILTSSAKRTFSVFFGSGGGGKGNFLAKSSKRTQLYCIFGERSFLTKIEPPSSLSTFLLRLLAFYIFSPPSPTSYSLSSLFSYCYLFFFTSPCLKTWKCVIPVVYVKI